MKKSTFTAVMLAVLGATASGAAMADEITGPYVQGDIGLAHIRTDTPREWNGTGDIKNNLKDSYKESGFMPRVSAGYDFGDWRVAGDYTHYKDVKEGNVTSKVRGAGVSAIYDIPVNYVVQPYVGARVGVNKLKQSASTATSNASLEETKVGVGAMVGANYKIDRNLTLDGGYRYNRLASKVNAHEVGVGLRYTFQ